MRARTFVCGGYAVPLFVLLVAAPACVGKVGGGGGGDGGDGSSPPPRLDAGGGPEDAGHAPCPTEVASEYLIDEVFWQYSYVTRETHAPLFIMSAAPGVADIAIGSHYSQAGVPLCAGENRVMVPLATIPVGEHVTLVSVTAGGEPWTSTAQLTRRPPLGQGNEVKVDHYHRSVVVNGEPFFPYGAALYNSRALDAYAAQGFNTVVRWNTRYASADGSVSVTEAAENDWLLETAHGLGLKVIDRLDATRAPWSYGPVDEGYDARFESWATNDVPEALAVIRSHPALLALMGLDEPELGGREAWARRAVEAFQTHDPYHPAFNNYAHGSGITAEQTASEDLISDYIYWRPVDRRGRHIANLVRQTVQFAHGQRKPAWIMPFNEMQLAASYVPLTPAEQRANTYLMMTLGVSGMYYFNWPSLHGDTVANVTELAGEVATLAPALLRRAPAQVTATEVTPPGVLPAVLLSLRTLPDGTPILLFVNLEDYAVDLAVRMPWLPSDASIESLNGRGHASLALDSGGFSEHLEPLATRAYRISGLALESNQVLRIIEVEEAHAPGAHHVTNLFANPGFEGDDYWLLRAEDPVRYDTSEVWSGGRSLMITRESADGPAITVKSPDFMLEPNHRYSYGAMRRHDVVVPPSGTTWGGFSVRLRSLDDDFHIPIISTGAKSFDWEPGRQDFRTYDDAHRVELQILDALNVGTARVDDVYLYDYGPVPPLVAAKNLVPNSSFEVSRLPGWPDRWQPRNFDPHIKGIFLGDAAAPFAVDDSQAHSGDVSLRVHCGSNSLGLVGWVDSHPRRSWYDGIPVTDGQTYTFSVYLRADQPDVNVRAEVDGIGAADFVVGTTWQRHSFTGVRQNGAVPNHTYITFTSLRAGTTLWIDSVQLEEGAVATAYVPDAYVPDYP